MGVAGLIFLGLILKTPELVVGVIAWLQQPDLGDGFRLLQAVPLLEVSRQ